MKGNIYLQHFFQKLSLLPTDFTKLRFLSYFSSNFSLLENLQVFLFGVEEKFVIQINITI